MAENLSSPPQDGTIRYQQLTKDYSDKAIRMMGEGFFLHENACKAIGISEDPEAIEEIQKFLYEMVKEGVTVIAVEKTTDEVVGAAFNRLLTRGDTLCENFAKSCKNVRSRYFIGAMGSADKLYEIPDGDCYFEIVFLGISTEFRRRGIAKKLLQLSIELATKLFNRINAKQSVDVSTELNLEPVPKLVTSVFTSFITQRIGRQLGFEILKDMSYDTLEYDGRLYSSIISGQTKGLVVVYKKLQ